MRRLSLVFTIGLGLAGCSNAPQNGGATGAAGDAYVGGRANVGATVNGSTQSGSMLEQRIKADSAAGATSGGGNTRY